MKSIRKKISFIKQTIINNQGFTFIELLIAIAILAILGTLVISRFTGVVPRAQRTVAEANIKTFETALAAYYFRFNQYPTTEEGLQKLAEVELLENAKAALIDPWERPYNYRYPGIYSNKPEIWSYGADGQEGGEGENADITNWE